MADIKEPPTKVILTRKRAGIAMAELYTKDILRLAMTMPHTARLSDPTLTISKKSRICGSTLTIDVVLKDGVVTAYGQDVKACALGQASASIVASHVLGITADKFYPVADAFEALINGKDYNETALWPELKHLEVVKDNPSRLGSVMLPFDALKEAFEAA